MRERNHFDGRPHRYKAFCLCPVCDKETRRRVSQFWTQTHAKDAKEMMLQLEGTRADRRVLFIYGL
jgi:hypothetical protein